jgi:hypothetical protein
MEPHQSANGTWYPTWRFNRAGESVRVESEAEDQKLKGEWFSSPVIGEDDEDDRFAGDRDEVDAMIDEEEKKKKKKMTRARKGGRGTP